MSSIGRLAAAALAAAALFAAPEKSSADGEPTSLSGVVRYSDGGVWIGGESDPAGWVLTHELTLAAEPWSAYNVIAYLDGTPGGVELGRYEGRPVTATGTLDEDALTGGGVETDVRTFDLLHVESISPRIDAPAIRRPFARQAARLRADLEMRGVNYADGSDTPSGGISWDGRLGRRRARIVPLAVPPEGSADMYTDVAFVDLRHRRYWARRTGGFMAVTQWVGPFRLPRYRVARVTLGGR
jgi:hypothetical protein